MSIPQTDAQEVQRYIEMLYPDPPPAAWLAVSWLDAKGRWCSRWFKIAQGDDAARYIVKQAQRYNVYVGLGLRHPDCTAQPGTRGESKDVYAIGGLWIELDHNAGVHAAHNLPTPDELLAFIEALPLRFSLLVDSGGGYHAYVLFKELWVLDTPDEHQAATLLLRRFQRTIQAQAAAHGWKVDSTADLARVLRPTGTLNHKSGTPKPVTLLHEDAIRSNPADIADAPWLATIEDTYTPPARAGTFPPARLAPIITGCAWLRHCRDDAARLPEPEWYAMLGIVGRCEDGEQIAHEWSTPYPRYSKDETARKLQHALADAGPRTCSTIRYDLGADSDCRDCQHWGKIKSPILLGMTPAMRRKAARALIPERFAAAWPGETVALTLLERLVSMPDVRLVYEALPTVAAVSPDAWQATKAAIKRLVGDTINLSDVHTVWKKTHGPHAQLSPANGTHPPNTTPLIASDDGSLPYSDYTNALALVRDHGQDLRYCYPWGKWLRWTSTHWETENDGAVMRCAKLTIKRLARHAEDLDDDKAVKALLAHVKSSLATAKLKALVESAQSEPGIPVQPQNLDTDGWLLNCTNGTIDLRTDTLRPHARDDLLTRCLNVPYDPQAPCPTWDAFLDRIMAGNQNLISFLQRAVGYALTGVIREHVLLILWGKGRNGKSTFLNTLRALLGPYGMKAPSELLLVSNNDRHPTERADLFGKRFVAAIETEQGRRLAEVFVKEATGGDPIRARRMREDFWEFRPTHKAFLATNHKPVITGTDNAIWERLRLVPFAVTIPKDERDTTLPDKLEAELPGILAWAVRGCLAWQEDGLGEPDEVQQATAGYRTEMDVLGQFIAECCLVGPNYRTKAADLYDAYKRWCEQNGEHADVQRTWGMALTEREYERKRGTAGSHWWIGIGLYPTTSPGKGNGAQDESDPRVTQVTDSDPKIGINQLVNSHVEQTGKLGSLGSLGSLPVDGAPTDAGDDYDEVVI